MKNSYKKTILFSALSLIVLSAVFFTGAYFGFSEKIFSNKNSLVDGMFSNDARPSLDSFWEVWDLIEEKYPESENISDEEKIWGAISGLTESLGDPYSIFMNKDDSKSFGESINGEFSGVGMEVGEKDNQIIVIAPLKDTPAYRAGIEPGDIILEIDGNNTTALSIEDAVHLIRGEKGTQVVLTIQREGENSQRDISITRDTISVPVIETEQINDVFVIRLFSFSAYSADLFRDALREFSTLNTDKLIIDLRGNPGGYLETSIDIASWFLPIGKPVVIEDFGGGQNKKIYRSKGYNIYNKNLKMVILVDQGSASASEILTGALSEHGVATVVGEQTYGKGSVQELIELPDKTSLKITIAKWLTPNGVSISEKGITPDVVVPYIPNSEGLDNQMDKALDIINNL